MFVPQIGQTMTVTLPGELLRAPVVRVVDRHTFFVEIGQPMTKNHSYRKGDLVACRRAGSELGEFWEAVDERLLTAAPEKKARAKKKGASRVRK